METSDHNDYPVIDDIRRVNEYGTEYWLARELQVALGYHSWRRFRGVIERAINACYRIGVMEDHFTEVEKIIQTPSGARRKSTDFELTRYACYLIIQSGDKRKSVIAECQSYLTTRSIQPEEETPSVCTESNRLQDLLDTVSSTERATILFCSTLTASRLRREGITDKETAEKIRAEIEKKVRMTFQE